MHMNYDNYLCFNHIQDHLNRCSEMAVRLINRLYHTPWLGSLMPHVSWKSLMGIQGILVFIMDYVICHYLFFETRYHKNHHVSVSVCVRVSSGKVL